MWWQSALSSGRRTTTVLKRELKMLARRRTPFVLRTLYGVFVALTFPIAASMWLEFDWAGGTTGEILANFGYRFFIFVTWLHAFLAPILGILLGAISAHIEQRDQTLNLLLISRLRPSEIVFGKWSAVLGLLMMVLSAGLPVMALVAWAGGVEPESFGRLAAMTAMLASLGTATGLLCGFAFRSGVVAVPVALTLLLMPAALHQRLASWTIFEPLSAIPQAVTMIARQNEGSGILALALGAGGVITALMIGLTGGLISISSIEIERKLRRFFEKILSEMMLKSSLFLGLEGKKGPLMFICGAATALMLNSGLRKLILGDTRAVFVFALGAGCVVALPAILGTTALGRERARKTLPTMLVTPLSARAIILSKVLSSGRALIVPLFFAGIFTVLAYDSGRTVTDLVIHFIGFLGLRDSLGYLAPSASVVLFALLAQGICGYFLAFNLSLLIDNPLRAGLYAIFLLAGLSLISGFFMLWSWKGMVDFPRSGFWSILVVVVLWLSGAVHLSRSMCRSDQARHGLAALLALSMPALGILCGSTASLFNVGIYSLHSGEVSGYLRNEPSIALCGIVTIAFLALSYVLLKYAEFSFDRALGRSE